MNTILSFKPKFSFLMSSMIYPQSQQTSKPQLIRRTLYTFSCSLKVICPSCSNTPPFPRGIGARGVEFTLEDGIPAGPIVVSSSRVWYVESPISELPACGSAGLSVVLSFPFLRNAGVGGAPLLLTFRVRFDLCTLLSKGVNSFFPGPPLFAKLPKIWRAGVISLRRFRRLLFTAWRMSSPPGDVKDSILEPKSASISIEDSVGCSVCGVSITPGAPMIKVGLQVIYPEPFPFIGNWVLFFSTLSVGILRKKKP
ncbi:hypothetical protein L873DRAFT_933297 [Choiromyces venosus 120613-1]|uniref:Uncharacterized protein n=1 Tax=Choiromyces venosus 120613-1 TaxID=1336337 RepID=A0A3N4JLU1_9PEZI|nr:hypothetical protein L873DRAFT_933297 [Choiromyces venosus 120613-1]